MMLAGRGARVVWCALLCVAAVGCRHKQPVPALAIPPPAPVADTTGAAAGKTGVLEKKVMVPVPIPEVKVVEKKVRRPRKKPPVMVAMAPPVEAPPAAVAGTGLAPESVIGALTAGGDNAPEKKQRADMMIRDLNKRLAGLAADVMRKQREGIARVRLFERQASQALTSGDADGAVTLATKAKLLLDDLVK